MVTDLSFTGERLLLVDDDALLLNLLKRYTALLNLESDSATNGKEAVQLLAQNEYGIVITDMVMPEMDGMELIKHMCEFYPQSDILVISGYTGKYSFTDLIGAGATDFIAKPFERDELHAKVERIFRERRLIAELYKAKVAAETASQIKSDFIHTISHELRTPMNGILGFSSLLCKVELGEVYADYLKMIRLSANRLMDLVNQILNFAKLEASKQDLHPTSFNVAQLIDDLVLVLQPKLEAKDMEVQVNIADDFPEELSGDIEVVGLIIHNLLDNAIKFSEEGNIVLEVTASEVTGDEVTVQVAITDTGCGIPEDKQGDIFKAFSQVESYETRRHQGAGLGLTICSRLVALMNGRIWMTSQERRGSIFSFTVVLKRVGEQGGC